MTKMWKIMRVWYSEAGTQQEALAAARTRSPDTTTVQAVEPPEERHDFREHYEQPIPVLDLAWDDYMDRSLPPDITNSVRLQLPSLVDLAGAQITPQQLSLIFDCAISAYRRHVELDGSAVLRRFPTPED